MESDLRASCLAGRTSTPLQEVIDIADRKEGQGKPVEWITLALEAIRLLLELLR